MSTFFAVTVQITMMARALALCALLVVCAPHSHCQIVTINADTPQPVQTAAGLQEVRVRADELPHLGL